MTTDGRQPRTHVHLHPDALKYLREHPASTTVYMLDCPWDRCGRALTLALTIAEDGCIDAALTVPQRLGEQRGGDPHAQTPETG